MNHIATIDPSASRENYSPFIMETVEKSLERVETSPAALRRSFPPPICNSRSPFWCFMFSAALLFVKALGNPNVTKSIPK